MSAVGDARKRLTEDAGTGRSMNAPTKGRGESQTAFAIRCIKAEVWDEVVEAIAWTLGQPHTTPLNAIDYMRSHNPHRIAPPAEGRA